MLITEPFLQLPRDHSVRVVWFTDAKTEENRVLLYEGDAAAPSREIAASSRTLSRLRGGRRQEDSDDAAIRATVWRHEALVNGLPPYHGKAEERRRYRVVSDGEESGCYYLQARPQPDTPLKILLTSDLQNKDMCAANLEKVAETVGSIDAVFANGDLVHVADRAYDWFYGENALFRVLQGKASFSLSGKVYHGAPILQGAPLYAALGNHEVMGKYSAEGSLHRQFTGAAPRSYGREKAAQEEREGRVFASAAERQQRVEDLSFNTKTWEELLNMPENEEGHRHYYAVTVGDVRLVVLALANMWRLPEVGTCAGCFSELPGALQDEYGFGQFLFEPITPDSPQYEFLRRELESEAFRAAKYKVVMCHWQHHSLGGNAVPVYTEPESATVTDPVTGLPMVIYRYPLEKDQIRLYVEPLLRKAGVQLFFNGHSHVWNRFCAEGGLHILECSCVGVNEMGCYDGKERVWGIPSVFRDEDPRASLRECWREEDYPLQGDPFGLRPQLPTVAPLPDGAPCLKDAECTAFSVLDTQTGCVDSYFFNTGDPESRVVHFDSFSLLG